MKTTYTVAKRHFDRFSGLHLVPGCTLELNETRRVLRFIGPDGHDMTNESHFPTDADCDVTKADLEERVSTGELLREPKRRPAFSHALKPAADYPPPSNKEGETEGDQAPTDPPQDDPAMAEPSKASSQKSDPPKSEGGKRRH